MLETEIKFEPDGYMTTISVPDPEWTETVEINKQSPCQCYILWNMEYEIWNSAEGGWNPVPSAQHLDYETWN